MRLVTTLLITLVFVPFAQAQTGAPATRTLRGGVETTAIRFGKLWDGSTVTTDAVVVVDGERITSVGTGNAAVPPGAKVIDLNRVADSHGSWLNTPDDVHLPLAGLLTADRISVLREIIRFECAISYDEIADRVLRRDRRHVRKASQLDRVLVDLEERGVVEWNREANSYDVCPTVRAALSRMLVIHVDPP